MALMTLCLPARASAGCGCDKPPPKPATVIPSVAATTMPITLFDPSMTAGQIWTVTFSSAGNSASVNGAVQTRRNIIDRSGRTLVSSLTVDVPDMPPGPTSITATNGSVAITVPDDSFVVIGNPVVVGEQNAEAEIPHYTTAVGKDGTFYMAVGGLDKVCQSMSFSASTNTLLRFGDGDVLIFNWQGYFIDSLTPASKNHFSIQPGTTTQSDQLHYSRHSFAQYCIDHMPGGAKQVDPTDTNWHLDGTPHVDYATVIFAIAAHLADGTSLIPGPLTASASVETELGDGSGEWETEQPEESSRTVKQPAYRGYRR